jgi:nucleoid-associated protein YgaU
MTPIDASSTIPANPDSILELMKLPAFQNLLAKVETNFYRNRPKEAADLELEGTIRFTLQERAAQAWEILAKARSTGVPMEQAQELISELVHPPLESDDN